MVIKYLIEKEFKQIARNKFLPRLIAIYPIVIIMVLPWAANLEIKNINLCVVDNNHSQYSRQLIHKVVSSGYFRLADVSSSYDEGIKSVEKGRSDIILEIPANFERDLIKEGNARLLISVNSVNGTKGMLGSAYMSYIVSDFSDDIKDRWVEPQHVTNINPKVKIVAQSRFNPHLDYKVFMIPALMVILLTVFCGFLPALNIVIEKEKGTIEQINVTPVSKFSFIIAKLIPHWIIGFFVLSICLALAALAYGLVPNGHLSTIYLLALLYVLIVSGFGQVLSNHSATMQQAMFVMFFFMMIMILLSGLFTPIHSMPHWAQTITIFNPLKYFVQIMRSVYLKGSGLADLGTQILALSIFAVFFNTWAILSYRKKSQ
ncbi:ABC transporter permease [Bacteroides sedimenti]|uniref:ABC transporter permease n=1 Tax=Bacteroides sedimenti TaxID=2136147 RepID=A0ABN6Z9C4_9BACE